MAVIIVITAFIEAQLSGCCGERPFLGGGCVAAISSLFQGAFGGTAAGTGPGLGSQKGPAAAAVGQSHIYTLCILRLLLLRVSLSSAHCCWQRRSGALEELFLFSVGTGG